MSVNHKCPVGPFPIAAFEDVDQAVGSILSHAELAEVGALVAINAEKIVSNMPPQAHMLELMDFATFYADGYPVARAMRGKGFKEARRIPGIELWMQLMRRAGQTGLRVFLLGGEEAVNAETAQRLTRELGVSVVGRHHGYFEDSGEVVEYIEACAPDIVCVAMGSPRQEKFIALARGRHSRALYMGVGGSYDVYTGKVARAPRWLRDAGLEWAYRLFKQPTRFLRYIRLFQFATIYVGGKL